MTDNTSLTQAIRMFAPFFDAIGQPVAIIDEQGRFIYYNQESAEIDGCSRKHAMGRPVHAMYSNIDADNSSMMQALQHDRQFINKYQLYINAAGKPVHYVFTTLPLKNAHGQTLGAIEIGRDLSLIHSQHYQVIELLDKLAGRTEPRESDIITADPAVKRLIRHARRLAQVGVPVLIYGETGTGKELFARLLHRHSPRHDKPFFGLNCAALPEALIESTLFGTVRGAFTGAEDRAGMLETINGGTLFLDELNSMPLSTQGKLLRAMQEHAFCRVGSSREIQVDVRILASTNEPPRQMLARQQIRSDLLYRLNVGYLSIPPLRKRRGDIALLAHHFLEKHGDVTGHRVKRISDAVLARLEQHPWPGNVRMLENVILRSLILCETGDELDFILLDEHEDPPAAPPVAEPELPVAPLPDTPDTPIALEDAMIAYERTLLLRSLARHPNLTEAARHCGIPRSTMQYKMKRHGIRLEKVLTEETG